MSGRRTIIIGAGLAGLTAGAYLARTGCAPLILEKSGSCGGLVQSFERDGYIFDTGPRALGDAGILRPLLKNLGIELPLVKGLVSTGIGKEFTHYDDALALDRYLASLRRLFPTQERTIGFLEKAIRSSCAMVRTLNRLPNPYFRNPLSDPKYLLREFLPWLPSFLSVALRTGLDHRPVEDVLSKMGADQELTDTVCRHFFRGTPWRFALGYFENFQDYQYPIGGTGRFPQALETYIKTHGGQIATEREVVSILPASRTVVDRRGEEHAYAELLWAGDLRSLYARIDQRGLAAGAVRRIEEERRRYLSAKPGESIFTLFLAVDAPPSRFGRRSRGHLIYSPLSEGRGKPDRARLLELKAGFAGIAADELRARVRDFCADSSYEISIPALKDPALAPEGKTGLIVSVLCDGELWETAESANRAEELQEAMTEGMLDILEHSLYPEMRSKLLLRIPATPLSLRNRIGTSAGAITGWCLEERPPVPSSLASVMSAVRTGIPHLWKAGQWSYSPAGVPVAILTGRIAAAGMARRDRLS